MPRFGNDPILTGRDEPGLLDVPTLDAVGATASETFNSSPSPAIIRAARVETAEEGLRQSGGSVARFGYLPNANRAPDSPILSKADADAKIDAAGLTGRLDVPADGIRTKALDLLMDYKSDEVRNQFILDRYRGGVAGGALNLSTALATSLVDPLNIASAFVPVVGEVRYAQILGRAGTSMFARAGVRGAVGGIEGSVGAAIVEPLIYQSKQAIQADYDSTDSLMNVGFGAIFGGVLQPAAGAFGDVLARRARMGAWAENIGPDLMARDPEMPAGWVAGGGAQFVEGDDYVRGRWAVAEASTLKAGGAPFDTADAGQLGASPWADSGAPVVGSDGAVQNGNRRMATVLSDYAGGRGNEYRDEVLSTAERYGLDSEVLAGMDQPVLMRVAGTRDVGAWGEFQKIAAQTPQARAQRVPFESPDAVAAKGFMARARGLGVADEASKAMAPVAVRDDVTGFYDGRQEGFKADTVKRAMLHVEQTGEPGVYVSADIANLGGLNTAMGNQAERANVHFRAMAGIMADELRKTGADVVPMRTGGDEMGAVVVNADMERVDKALSRAERRIDTYARQNGLADIPHPKRSGENGVGLHFGMADLTPGRSLSDIFDLADNGVDLSKNGGSSARQTQIEASREARAGEVPGRPGEAARGAGAQDQSRIPLTQEQQHAAISVGVAQAVNGERINVATIGELDGTQAGVARFLEAKRQADAAEIAGRDRTLADLEKMRVELDRFSPEQAEKLDKDVAELEAQLREQVRAGGGDEADIDAALSSVADVTDAADTEAKALRGVALCMLRSA